MDPIISSIVLTSITEITKTIISDYVKPQLLAFKQYFNEKQIEDGDVSKYLEKNLSDYLTRTYDSLSLSDTLIGETAAVRLEDVYTPLQIVDLQQKTQIEIKYGSEILNLERTRIMFISGGGMGKTTLLKMIGLSCIEKSLSCPILINLRKLTTSNGVLDEIYQQFDQITKTVNKEIILQLLESGRFVVLFDGIDEIAFSNKRIIIEDLKNFISKTSSNIFVIASREDRILTSFSDFQRYSIKPFQKEQADSLLNKYDKLTSCSIAPQVSRELGYNNYLFRTLISNPILVTMVYNVYYHTKKLPSETQELINRILEIYIKEHDYSKLGFIRPHISELGVGCVKGLMTWLAFFSLKKGSPLFTSNELRDQVEHYFKSQSMNCKTEELIDELLISFPVFQKDGLDLRWQHKIFQDYFCAEFICNNSRKYEIVQKLFTSSKRVEYYDIIRIISEIDKEFFMSCIVPKVLKSFIEHFESSYTSFSNFDPKIVDFRRAITFGRKSAIYLLENSTDEEWEKMQKKFFVFAGQIHEMGQTGYVDPSPWFISNLTLEARLMHLLFDMHLEIFTFVEEVGRQTFRIPEIELTLVSTRNDSSINNTAVEQNKVRMDKVKLNFSISEKKLLPLNEDIDNPLNNPTDFHIISNCFWKFQQFEVLNADRGVIGHCYPDFLKIREYLEKESIEVQNNIKDDLLEGL